MRYSLLTSCIVGFCMISGNLTAQPVLPPLCNTSDSIGMYTLTMEFSKNTLTGLLILKKTSDSTLRLVLNAEMGPKLLDMELSPDGYKTIYAFKKLNRKRILRTFYEDFSALSGLLIWNRNYNIDSSEVSTFFTYDLKKQKKITYFTNTVADKVVSGQTEDNKSVKTIFYYFYNPSASAISSLKLEHQHFRMVILLNKISL